jgi:TPR repeat protein
MVSSILYESSIGAQFNLGVSYEYGEGVEKDEKESMFWYMKSASLRHPGALVKVANTHFEKGIPEDYVKALEYYKIEDYF